jgi:Flp pilus assembly protein TadB
MAKMERDASNSGQRKPGKRLLMLALGPTLIVASPVVGLIPGPGGLLVLLAGVALTLQGSQVAKRLYVRAKRRWPSLGHWSDKGLRRPSRFRRLRRKRETATAADSD